jgi:Ala-tRNA(Pro) deacylase
MVMPVQRLKEFLDERGVKYVSIVHSSTFTAQEIAASAHIPGNEVAKTVVARIDGRMAMAVVPASFKVDLQRLAAAAGAEIATLCDETEFRDRFPGCEVGAMPPFGNLYGMDVYVSGKLADDEEIAFNAGSHTELIKLAYADFERLVEPWVGDITYGHCMSGA